MKSVESPWTETSPRPLPWESILSAAREGPPVLLFSCVLFRPQSTCDIADSKALPQTTLLLLVRVNVDFSNDTSSSLVIVQLVPFSPQLLRSPHSRLCLLKYCSISCGKDGNVIQNGLDCLVSIVHSPQLTLFKMLDAGYYTFSSEISIWYIYGPRRLHNVKKLSTISSKLSG